MNKNLEKMILGGTMLALSACASGNSVKKADEIMRDNTFISGQELPKVKMSEKNAMYGVEILKRMYECESSQCLVNRPVIAGYDTFDEKTKGKALVDYITELNSSQGGSGATNILTNLDWKFKTWVAKANIADSKYNAMVKDIGTTAFWVGIAAFYSGGSTGTAISGTNSTSNTIGNGIGNGGIGNGF